MTEVWFRPYVWMDYWLELLFVLIIPIILLIWVFVQKSEAMQRLLMIYWRVSSLLAISIYLMIGGFGVSYICFNGTDSHPYCAMVLGGYQ
jgi:glucan phosphoethanolaminetransferase (alkaline phosphatase superfamily)